jgi:DNA (cytosine-5)-methyltransferase 1
MTYRVLSLFSGIGSFDLGLERTGGFRTVALCEINPYRRKVLARHWPEIQIHEDVRTLTADALARDGIEIDAIVGGFPCRNVSIAGYSHGIRSGITGEHSGLWDQYERLIEEIRPKFVIVENVRDLLRSGLDRVLRGLAALGYDAEWQVLPGPFAGIPQSRERVWLAAYPAGIGVEGLFESLGPCAPGSWRTGGEADLFDIADAPFGGDDRFPQPLLRGVDDRPPCWVDRIGACGDSGFPQIAEIIGRAILSAGGTANV